LPQLGVGVRIVVAVERTLGDGDVARLPDEPPELGRRHRVLVHPKIADLDLLNRSFLRVEVLGAHPEGPAPDQRHLIELSQRHHSILSPGLVARSSS
jgi:hypothetical protein